MSLLSQTTMLYLLARMHPQAIDALVPHIPVISEKVRNIQAASIIKTIAKRLDDAEIATELHNTGRTLFNAAAKQLSYDDDISPSHPKPWYEGTSYFGPQPEPWFAANSGELFFGPQPQPWVITNGDEVALNPQPLPPHEVKYYGAILTTLADAISVEDVADTLRNIGLTLMKQPVGKYQKNLS